MTTILVVDDNLPNQRLLGFILEQNNYEVLTANNGVQALAQLEARPIDLLVTDLSMPEMDGVTLVQRMRDSERYKHVPVIVLTASGLQRDLARATDCGANACLTKPLEPDDLVATIHRLIK